MEKLDISRRDFVIKAGFGLATLSIGLAGCTPKEAISEAPVEVACETPKEVAVAIPSLPWSFTPLEPEPIRIKGHASYYEGSCCYGSFNAIIGELQEKVGFPFSQIPTRMMEFGAGGVAGWGTTCGSLIGAAAAINLVTEIDIAKNIIDQLMTWYTQEPFPSQRSNEYATTHAFLVKEYKSDKELAQSISHSPLCQVSVAEWCKASGYASGSKERSERCGRLTGDVAAKAVELLNANLSRSFSPAFNLSNQAQGLERLKL